MPEIASADLEKVDLRVGRILRVEPFPKARVPAYNLGIDFGPLGVKQSSAQLTNRYRPEDLEGRLVIAVTNFPPKRITGFRSDVRVAGIVPSPGDVVLLRPDADVPLGLKVAQPRKQKKEKPLYMVASVRFERDIRDAQSRLGPHSGH